MAHFRNKFNKFNNIGVLKHQKFHECAARMKISMFSTHEMKYIWYLLKKVNFLFFYFLEDLQLLNLLTMLQAES